MPAALAHAAAHGSLPGFFGAEPISEDEINARLESIMIKAFEAIWQTAQERQVSIRTAAFIIACQRVLAAREQRGLYP